MYVAYLNNEIVAMCAVLPQPGVLDGDAWRIHRLVVLPDYQGLGIGTKLLEFVCDLFKYHNKTIYLKTSHTKLIKYMINSYKWFGNGKLKSSVKEGGLLKGRKQNFDRLMASFKYVFECENIKDKFYNSLIFSKKENKEAIEHFSIFDFME